MQQKTMGIVKYIKLGEIQKCLIKKDTNNQGNIKLPKLELTKFDGNIIKWQEFWDLCVATIYNSNSQSKIDKLNYLRAQFKNYIKA